MVSPQTYPTLRVRWGTPYLLLKKLKLFKMEFVIESKNSFLATAKSADGKTVLNFTKTNSSWYDWSIGSKRVGDKFDVPEDNIQMSDKGRPFIQRLNAEKFVQALQIEREFTAIDLMKKRYERESQGL
jgi:hypothetical protein